MDVTCFLAEVVGVTFPEVVGVTELGCGVGVTSTCGVTVGVTVVLGATV